MGKAQTSCLANLFMISFETEFKRELPSFSRVWLDFKDHVFVSSGSNELIIHDLLSQPNNIFCPIKNTNTHRYTPYCANHS